MRERSFFTAHAHQTPQLHADSIPTQTPLHSHTWVAGRPSSSASNGSPTAPRADRRASEGVTGEQPLATDARPVHGSTCAALPSPASPAPSASPTAVPGVARGTPRGAPPPDAGLASRRPLRPRRTVKTSQSSASFEDASPSRSRGPCTTSVSGADPSPDAARPSGGPCTLSTRSPTARGGGVVPASSAPVMAPVPVEGAPLPRGGGARDASPCAATLGLRPPSAAGPSDVALARGVKGVAQKGVARRSPAAPRTDTLDAHWRCGPPSKRK